MLRLLIITDFTESFPTKLLQGIIRYSRRQEQWAVCRMPPFYKKQIGIPGVVKWAKTWGADAVIGQFEQDDPVEMFAQNGIVAVAQDFKKRFTTIPNITGDYIGTGRMAARYFIDHGFRNFGFFGFKDVCWSDERREGFRLELEEAGFGEAFCDYTMQDIDKLWYYERKHMAEWLRSIPKPIAIMACDDNQGNNLIEACHTAGIKIPDEIAVLGVDNDEMLCNLGSTALSSIAVDIEDGGYRTAELIEKMFANPGVTYGDIVLEPVKIVERMSTAGFATGDAQIRKVLQTIHKNICRRIPVTELMTVAAMSRRALERRFRAVTGESIYKYITDLRLKHFADMLTDTAEPVNNIALSMGESDTKTIARCFKQIYGCSPLEWREKHQKPQEQ